MTHFVDLQHHIMSALRSVDHAMNVCEIASFVAFHEGYMPTAADIAEAIEALRSDGWPIVEHDGVDTRYWLDDGGMAA